MKSIFALITLGLISTSAFAEMGPKCTDADAETWMEKSDFISMVGELGYDTDGFTITDGNCYALTSLSGEAGKMEYFDPVTGAVVQ